MRVNKFAVLAVLVSCLLFFCVGHAVAAEEEEEEGVNEGAKDVVDEIEKTDTKDTTASVASDIHMSDFTSSSSPTDGLGEAKPLMMEVVAIVIGLFLVTCIIAIFVSGSTANVGNILHNISLRSRGIVGVITVLGVIGAVIVTLVMFFHLYNKYLAGM